jgi:MoxR-like ATPase
MTASPGPTSRTPLTRLRDLQENVEHAFRGKSRVVRLTIACLLARGHLLLEDVPGVGKTTLALAIARSLGLHFQRIQFTSDLLPSDIVGVTVFSPKTAEFEFKQGPVFANVVLADEINRTTPRTQSALLEAMSEGKVSVEDRTHDLPNPFLVIATQNPLEHHGTYPLPESQLDRFLMRLSIGYPGKAVERSIILSRGSSNPVEELAPVLDPTEFRGLQDHVDDVTIDESIVDYLMKIVEETRNDARVRIGVSTRGALALARVTRAYAMVQGRDFVIPDDVRDLLVPVFAHRLSLASATPGGERTASEGIIEELATRVPIPS